MADDALPHQLPTRRQWHMQRDLETGEIPLPSFPSRASRWGLRVVVLCLLAALTVVIPLTGLVDPVRSISLPVREVGTDTAGKSWANTLVPLEDDTSLTENISAATRARVRTPVTLSPCVPSDTAAAGGRTVTQSSQIYFPVPAGAYEYTSPFGPRIDPLGRGESFHSGSDFAGPLGTPIYAVADGEVIKAAEAVGAGTNLKIRHMDSDGSVFYSVYYHQYINQITVSEGDQVKAGQHIGAIGNNGWSTGPHLHLEIHDSSDTPVDPMVWLLSHRAVHLGQEC
ncbi:M23 family metallopeptidase [Schaalia sp. lx-100]|uniref:M23 family metallopeptidase n=1 Tax=Schaalia sp. lx-100 TaxID=2899081 RepID=UPI001E4BD3A7|nr:M23 family metallopeptidase [Schaalia sp. lx-100]MCD4556732.1 M23 family metallopeptidase [Schaalia sp. lx-100]